MHNDSTPGHDETPLDQVALDDAQDFLDEMRRATEGSEQVDLHQFVCLLSQVVRLQQEQGQPLPKDADDGTFILTALDRIRSLVAEGEHWSEAMNAARDQLMQRWGDHLDPVDTDPLPGDGFDEPQDDDQGWTDAEQEIDGSHDSVPIAPSAEEIESMLRSLGPPAQDASLPDTSRPEPDPRVAVSAAGSSAESPADDVTADDVTAEERQPDDDDVQQSIAALDPEIRDAFLDDARSCVSSMEESSLGLESDPQSSEPLQQICRDLHTLKGASASVGLAKLADQLHALEERLRGDQLAHRSPAVDELLNSVDQIRSQVLGKTRANPREARADEAPSSLTAALPLDSFADEAGDDESVRVKSSRLNRLMDMLAELVMLRNRRETELDQLQDVYHELIGSVSKMRLINDEDRSQDTITSSLQLSEVANDVLEVAQSVRDCARPVAEGNAAVSQLIRQFRQELVELRRTPISGLFRRLQRAVRDAAKAESKQVQLQLLGENAAMERTLQQRLYEPLLHIVRNSVCHGIESPQERLQSGKPPAGTISLEAKSSSDLFVIEIRDDGRGLDYDAIRRRGIEAGLLAADQAVSQRELSQLIFQAGFSTRQSANQIAGRGVGMDVVATALRRMRGWLEVESESRRGTRIRLSFPMPSVIQHAMVFRAANQLFALPMPSVKSAGEYESDSVYLHFAQLISGSADVDQSNLQDCHHIVLAGSSRLPGDSSPGNGHVTLLVDEIVGPEEVVVRPLPRLARNHPFCCGATLSGMGEIVLLLDARRIIESQQHHDCSSAVTHAQFSQQSNGVRQPRVLVADDSRSARKRVVRSLQRYPLEIIEACDGRQALAVLKAEKLDAVFSDMEMPYISGMELLAQTHSEVSKRPPSVVIISSRGEPEFTERAKELGASSYLIKPLSDEALDQALLDIEPLRHFVNRPLTETSSSGDIA